MVAQLRLGCRMAVAPSCSGCGTGGAGPSAGDAEQAPAERPGGGHEGAAPAVGVQGAQQEAVEAVDQERGGLYGLVLGYLGGPDPVPRNCGAFDPALRRYTAVSWQA